MAVIQVVEHALLGEGIARYVLAQIGVEAVKSVLARPPVLRSSSSS